MALIAQAASYTTVTIDQIPYRLYDETMEAHVYYDNNFAEPNVTNNRIELPETVNYDDKTYTVTEIKHFSSNGSKSYTIVTSSTVTKVSSVYSGVIRLILAENVSVVTDMQLSRDLQAFEVVDRNMSFSAENGVLYDKDKTKLYYAPYGRANEFVNFTVPATVKSIGDYAFYNFGKLNSISLPDGLKSIGNEAFYECKSLTNCTLPDELEVIGSNAFRNCNLNVNNFKLPSHLRRIGGWAFGGALNSNSLTSFTIPQNIEYIGTNAFFDIEIPIIYIHCKPCEIGENAFSDHISFTVFVPRGMRDIFSTYMGWRDLSDIEEGDFEPWYDTSGYECGSKELDGNRQYINQKGLIYYLYKSGVAKVNCSSYDPATGETVLKVPESVYFRANYYTVDAIEQFGTKSQDVFVDLQLPNTITSISDVRGGVKILRLPRSVTSVSSLHNCYYLERFEVDEENQSFSTDEYGVLYDKNKKKLFFAPHGKISSFTSFTVPSTVTSIGGYAFSHFDKLVSIFLPEGLKEIEVNSFEHCETLYNCQLPSTVEKIGKQAFINCPLRNFSLPWQIRTIEEQVFGIPNGNLYGYQCLENGHMKVLFIPPYLQSIGSYAFINCQIDSIKSYISDKNAVLPISMSAFDNQSNIKLVVPTGMKEQYKVVSGWNYMTDITESDDLLPSAYMCLKPVITRSGNILTITAQPEDAKIYYTLDGKEPTANSNLYDKPIEVVGNCTVKAVALKEGLKDSPVASFTVDWFTVADVEIRVTDDLAIEMTTQTEGATIRYTLDGTDPTENGYVYPNKPVSIGNDCTIKAVGIKNNFNNSKITSYVLNWAQLTCPKPTFRLSGTKLYIEATLTDVTVYYTMDGTEPTKSSPQYVMGEPIELTSNITIKAFCTKKGYRDSEVGTYVTSAFNVSSPIITREGNTISITTETAGATIYYTLDGSEPTKNSTPYDAANPIVASRNCTIKAIAFKDGYNNSPVMTFTVDWFTVADVVIRVLENLSVEMNTDTEGATIYYTKDGNDPTVNSSIYDAGHPFVLTENCTIKAIAMKKDYKSSQITKVVVDWLKVANVRIRLNDDLEIEMTTDTEGATIKYTDDGSDPAENGKVYPGRPMSFLSDCTIKAIGTKTGFNDSEITVFSLQWAQWTCPKPTFRYSGKKLYIETVMEGANIYYTIDGDEPTKNSTQYTLGVPIELAQNCTVRAIVTKPGYRNSEPATEVVEIFVVSPPSFELQADNRLKITCNDPADAAIYYGIGEDAELSILYQNPIILTDNRVIRAIAKKSGYKDSPIESYNPTQVACEEPSLENYDGRFFTLKVPEGATVYYAQNGDPYSGEMYREKGEVKGLGTLRCVAKHPYKNDSKVVDIPINYYYGGDGLAEVNGVGVLQNSFGWSGTDDITALNVRGPLNATDLEFIKTKFQQLQHLNLEQTTIKERALTTGAFAGMPSLVTFYSPKDIINVGESIFANCPRLAAIVWNASEKIPDNALGEQKNPNLLVYASNRLLAPAGVVNVVQNGSASSIVLTDVSEGNNNFYCPIAFKVERISYTHNYSMETKVGECQGWETIALPFTVQKITHKSKGELTPFKKFEEEGSSENARPFWLRALTPTGFEDVATLEANTPYIICMPNSTAYASRYNVNGNVTFSAENTEVPATEMTVVEKGENAFTATFLKKEKKSSVWPINKNEEYMGYMPGSAFVPNLRDVSPFEAYAYNRNSLSAPRILSLAEIGGTSGTTGILLMLNDEQKNDGAWYTVDGRKLRQKPTTKGVYIKNGKKIIMK